MKNLTEIKNKISNYDYMSYQEYKNLKEEIFSLDDDSISKLYGTTMDSIDEKETELYFLEAEAERDMKNWYARTKYFNKLYNEVSDYMHDLFDKEMEADAKKSIEQTLAETDSEVLVNYLKYLEDKNNKVSTLSIEERQKHINISKEILSARA